MDLQEARKYLPKDYSITDEELTRLLAEDYTIANLVVDEVLAGHYTHYKKTIIDRKTYGNRK